MARKFINEKGFAVYEMTGVETMEFGGYGICDSCNKSAVKGYLIPVLNSYFCEECYKRWIERAKYYEEDRLFEMRKIGYYDSILSAEEE